MCGLNLDHPGRFVLFVILDFIFFYFLLGYGSGDDDDDDNDK